MKIMSTRLRSSINSTAHRIALLFEDRLHTELMTFAIARLQAGDVAERVAFDIAKRNIDFTIQHEK